jgi:hypothetical protein
VTRPLPPGGHQAPQTAEDMDGTPIDLGPLAIRLCDLYFAAFPADVARLGPAGRAWCDHDSRFLLAWALQDARTGVLDCVQQVLWLGGVLAAREFPIANFLRHLELTVGVLRDSGLGELGERAALRLQSAADALSQAPISKPGPVRVRPAYGAGCAAIVRAGSSNRR